MTERLPVKETGNRMTNFGVHPISDGRHIVLTFLTEDPDTKKPTGEVRFFMTTRGLSMLIAKLNEGARRSIDMLVATGAAQALRDEIAEGLEVLTVTASWLAPAHATNKVALELETAEGPLLAFALDPQQARTMAQQLLAATVAAEPGGKLS
jgi:hypothetical protein